MSSRCAAEDIISTSGLLVTHQPTDALPCSLVASYDLCLFTSILLRNILTLLSSPFFFFFMIQTPPPSTSLPSTTLFLFFLKNTAPPEIYTFPLHAALRI